VRIYDVVGADIQWVPDDLAPSLSYFTIGSSMPSVLGVPKLGARR